MLKQASPFSEGRGQKGGNVNIVGSCGFERRSRSGNTFEKINIIYSRNRTINSNFVNSRNKWRERAKASCFLLNGEENSFSDTYKQKKRLDNSNLSPFPCGS